MDLISVIAILCLFVGLILGINNLAEYDFFSVPVLGGLVVGIAGLLVLVKRSSHLEQPIVNLSILKMVNLLDMLLLSSCFKLSI